MVLSSCAMIYMDGSRLSIVTARFFPSAQALHPFIMSPNLCDLSSAHNSSQDLNLSLGVYNKFKLGVYLVRDF